MTYIILDNIVLSTLSSPYGKCIPDVKNFNSDYVREIINSGHVYRKINCDQLCIQFNYSLNCDDSCPLECDSVYYKQRKETCEGCNSNELSYYYKIGLVKVGSDIIKNYNQFEKGYVHVYAYYEDLLITEMSELPKTTFSGLVANVGGTLGLFLGLSLLSLVEILRLIVELVKDAFFKIYNMF